MKFEKPIYVTMPALAPLEEVDAYLRQVWESGIMTHNGPLVQRFEEEFTAWSGSPAAVAVCNGTLAIQMALRALNLPPGSEIITTPFTFIATLTAILYEGFVPRFVDIDPETLNMDPVAIEAAITPKTAAILPVHVFGNPCDVEAIAAVAARHGLKTVYDGAHAIGVIVGDRSVFSYGDVSTTSFHATKLLNTSEGGAVFSPDPEIEKRLRELRFFGYDDRKDVACVGTNAKMTEVNASIGLANLRYLDRVLTDRKHKYALYKDILSRNGNLRFQKAAPACNCSYFPVILPDEATVLRAQAVLNSENIFPRRYFYPSVNIYGSIVPDAETCPHSEDISKRILCLPLYSTLPEESVRIIASTLLDALAQ